MENKQIDVLVVVELTNLQDKEKFEAHVKKEGFTVVENENLVYTGKSTTSLFATKAYILEVFAKALTKQDFKGEANLIFLLNETPHPTYSFKHDTKDFRPLED